MNIKEACKQTLENIEIVGEHPIYVLFELYGEGDSNRAERLISLHRDLFSVKEKLKKITLLNITHDLAHPNMKKNNNYLYVGKLEDCSISINFSCFGGFVAQLIEAE